MNVPIAFLSYGRSISAKFLLLSDSDAVGDGCVVERAAGSIQVMLQFRFRSPYVV